MILRVYADESYTDKAEVFSGFMESSDYWARFERRWKAVLNDFKAPYFHFREFADRENKWRIKGNPYLKWSEKQRERFIYELAMVLSESAVPIGGILDVKKAREIEDPRELLIAQFYVHFSHQLNSHRPGFNGQVLFIFDENDNSDWIATLNKVHKRAQEHEPRIGGLAFERDIRCPPLQAADLYAYAARQNSERYYDQNRTRQPKRVLDWILSKNSHHGFKKHHSTENWERLARLVMADEKQKKALWAKKGESKKKYYPELHFEYEKHGLRIIDQELAQPLG